jgi:site-specific DNA recombinase
MAILGPRSTALDADRKRVIAELQSQPPAAHPIALHPVILKRYEDQVVRLENVLGKGFSAGDTEAAEAIRDLVETITVSRNVTRPGGVRVEISGRLNSLIGGQAYPSRVTGVWGKMVAGVRYIAIPTISEALFSYRRAA